MRDVARIAVPLYRGPLMLPARPGYALAVFPDWRAALSCNVPVYSARLRPPQLLLGCAGLMA